MIRLGQPWSLLVLVFFVFVWPRLRTFPAGSAIRRGVAWLCLGVALAGPEILWGGAPERVMLAVDLSASASRSLRESLPLLSGLVRALPESTSVGLVGFGARAYAVSPPSSDGAAALDWLDRLAGEPGIILPSAEQDQTDIAAGLEVAGWALPASQGGRVILVSDGWETRGDARGTASILAGRGIAVDVLTIESRSGDFIDAAVEDVEAPGQVLRGLTFEVGATIRSTAAGPATASLSRDGAPVARQDLQLSPGDNPVRFVVTAETPGERRYGIRVALQGDQESRNDVAEAPVIVLGPPRVLWIGGGRVPGLRGLDVTQVRPDALGDLLARLRDFHVVVLANVALDALPRSGPERLQDYVSSWGGGLLMTGSESFGPGGYRGTPIEEILPVDLDAGNRRQRPGLGLVLALDKSGSMGESLGAMPKMAAAREAALITAGLLEASDRFGLLVFDSRPARMLPLEPPPGREQLRGILAGIEPGGGTRILPALAEAAAMLEAFPTGRRHVVLVTDGRGEGGDFAEQARRLAARGITVSAIAVGDDADTALLHGLAAAGGGRFELARDAGRLAAALRREVVLARGPLIHEGRINVLPSPHPVSEGVLKQRIPPLYGFISTTPKPFAVVALRAETGEPVLALGNSGLGRSAALTTDLDGPWGAEWRAWSGAERLLAQLLRWLVRAPLAGALSMRQEPTRDGWTLTVDAEDAEGNRLNGRAFVARLRDDDGRDEVIGLGQRRPGGYSAKLGSRVAKPTRVMLEDRSEGQGRLVGQGWIGLSYPEEYRLRPPHRALLEEIRRVSGGQSLEHQQAPPMLRPTRSIAIQLWPWLAGAALGLFLLDLMPFAYLPRMGQRAG